MNYRLRVPLLGIVLLMAAAPACSNGGGPDAVGTQVAATLSAFQTSDAATAIAAAPASATAVAPTPTVGQTAEVRPSDTPTPTNTSTTAPPTATNTLAGPTAVTIPAGANTGGVYSPPATVFGAPNVGDDESNASRQGFVTFVLSGIPAGATITAVSLDLTPFDQLGNPWGLSCLHVIQHDFGVLDVGDFSRVAPIGGLWRFCSAEALSDPVAQAIDPTNIPLVQAVLLAAGRQFQVRLQFDASQNNNDVADLLRPTPMLIVTYIRP